MSRVSPEFGKLVKEWMVEHKLTFRAAGLQSSVSAAYWKDMADGRVPSEEMIERMCRSFKDLDEAELRAAAGYAPIPGTVDAVTAVKFALRGQKSISEDGKQQILDFVKKIEQKHGKKA